MMSGNNRTCDGFGSGTGRSLKIVSGSVSNSSAISYLAITLTVADPVRGGAGQDSVRLFPVAYSAPTVFVSTGKQRFSAHDRVVLTSSVDSEDGSAVDFSWSTADGDVDISLAQNRLSANSKRHSITVKPNVLLSGGIYTFRLSVNAFGNIGWAEASIRLNIPPSQGELRVSPESGYALQTVFSFMISGWQDAELDLPIMYQVEYYELTAQVLQGDVAAQVFRSEPQKNSKYWLEIHDQFYHFNL
jgi:hypothetical protein